ncbi:hypothetical protein Rahaq2_3667 [Rahnella aquatilis CIP 78.65 = ATCC 33071]|uniref:Uncharacterized protein n=1 Tax=Rahnella aquatilis (strain ATCC 33071 / DSM 4594 / JCM 1683 / NBRC 105701 / NCIMB 13365 / CIP 78.65) TaxID=745277 RepID=H2IPE7_RAHAC|nr:hypothetical protein Rahaq2_3667 [Rahnella aquatilis CIP 78.65 = ATCC 33071]
MIFYKTRHKRFSLKMVPDSESNQGFASTSMKLPNNSELPSCFDSEFTAGTPILVPHTF